MKYAELASARDVMTLIMTIYSVMFLRRSCPPLFFSGTKITYIIYLEALAVPQANKDIDRRFVDYK